MALGNPFKRRQSGRPAPAKPTTPDPQAQGPTTGPLSGGGKGDTGAGLHQAGQVTLVNYSPEEQMQQIDRTLSRVHFGISLNHKFKQHLAELSSLIAPMTLFAA